VLFCAVSCDMLGVLFRVVPCCAVLYFLCYTDLFYIFCTLLCCHVLCYGILPVYCNVMCCTVLFFAVLDSMFCILLCFGFVCLLLNLFSFVCSLLFVCPGPLIFYFVFFLYCF
jgi:hypothetical protein